MRDPGLDEAIRAAGGVGALARKIGISQPSVSNWSHVPAERVLAGRGRDRREPRDAAARSLRRAPTRPMTRRGRCRAGAGIRAARRAAGARARRGAARRLSRPARRREPARARACGARRGGEPHRRGAASSASIFDLFIGLGRGELLPYGSYYLTGFLHERPLARLREDLAQLGIERVDGQAEPEDHAAILCEIMAGLASGRFPAPAGADRELFEKHLAPWIGRFFADLERAEAADFYRRVGALGRVFIEIETEAFALPA